MAEPPVSEDKRQAFPIPAPQRGMCKMLHIDLETEPEDNQGVAIRRGANN